MCSGIALDRRDLPEALIAAHGLCGRIALRGGGTEEIHFLLQHRTPMLPAWQSGEICILEWGNLRNISKFLPKAGHCRREDLEAGKWQHLRPVEVNIPCAYGFDRGIWFQLTEGLKAISVQDEFGRVHLYLLTQPASHYYRVMTRSDRMPVFLGRGM